MSCIMDATPGTIPLECLSCHLLKPTAICYCDAELCQDCTPSHLALCAHARVRLFKSWKPSAGTARNIYQTKREKR